MFKKEDAFILKPDGRRLGPYKATFAGGTVIVDDKMADIDDGDQVMRLLPSGKEEIKHINQCNFYDTSIAGYGPHYQLKVKPVPSTESYTVKHQTINVGSHSNVQIGDHNRMEFRENIQNLISIIEKSSASESEKEEAKGLLKKFLEHPLVTTIAGSAVGAFLS
ncbi:hypothetical protein [Pantoea dispersa]|uniref:hypothetical protein n=1 Tax=Pantoea dispersa TaxID=59814 RepID=UPI002857DF53|nr:hypothetical protein [Pantoea dispersa]MDR6297751.1 hypothetical protein [Pantoea dispersa]